MAKKFNITGNCRPESHYMVDITARLQEIEAMVDQGDYITINRARQYGKTTTLRLLADDLQGKYIVVSLDFQNLDSSEFSSVEAFVEAFAREFYLNIRKNDSVDEQSAEKLRLFAEGEVPRASLRKLFLTLSECCARSRHPIVLMIDEVDAASNFQVFLDFLAQLRSGYLHRDVTPTFQSVILAGVQNIRNIKQKLRSESDHQTNSPWNVASVFLLDMNFSVKDIEGMLQSYETDYGTGMDIAAVSRLIFDYTSGYPVLVSGICKNIDERIAGTDAFPDRKAAWTSDGVIEAVSYIYNESNMLFESLQDKLDSYPELREMLFAMLMEGKPVVYNRYDPAIQSALMYGFIRIENKNVVVANRIFETQLYDTFLASPQMRKSELFLRGDREKYQFIKDGRLDMKLILERFVVTFDDLYGDQSQKFIEEDGRRYFLLYLRPIINGTGNYYIEFRTRNQERTDVIVDYLGEQYVCELKIWRGNSYHERGEQQLTDYLDYYHLKKGYMLSFNFNQKKQIGVKEIALGDKVLVEAVV
ncbi:MAG: AAA-like domain-containing protein [Lachnospiraceae bacterium]|nr:AAA-like domain-containing protein [Lachnospiraceae bacterium]